MKLIKIIGLFCLFIITFFYTEKVIDISLNQDYIMIKIKENNITINPQNAYIENDTIIPGKIGKEIDYEQSYKAMKKIGYYEPSLLIYKNIYPEISIYNNYDKYIIKGNDTTKSISLIYILNNNNTIDKILEITNRYNTIINFFIDSSYLSNNIDIIDKLEKHEVYNYGANGIYTKDNLIIANNIINNKANNKAIFCLFTNKDYPSVNNCANIKMFSILINEVSNYINIKNNTTPGTIFLINNSQELTNIIEYINSKGYTIAGLSSLITE